MSRASATCTFSAANKRPRALLNKKSPKTTKNIILKAGVWNVRGCGDEWLRRKICEQVAERNFDIVVLTETRMRDCEVERYGEYTLHNSGNNINERPSGGIAMVIRTDRMNHAEFKPEGNRLATMKSVVNGVRMCVIGAYAPTECSENEDEKDVFYNKLAAVIQRESGCSDEILVLGDFNCRIGTDSANEYGPVVGKYVDETETSRNGMRVIDLCHMHRLRVENTFYKKKWCKKHTWYHPGSQRGATLDLVLYRPSKSMKVHDVRVSRLADANSDHHLVTVILKVSCHGGNSRKPLPQMSKGHGKWSTPYVAQAIMLDKTSFGDRLSENLPDEPSLSGITSAIRKSAAEVAQLTRKPKNDWWAFADATLETEVSTKRKLRMAWLRKRNAETKVAYQRQVNKVKRMVKYAKESYVDRCAGKFNELMEMHEMKQAYETLDRIVCVSTNRPAGKSKSRTYIPTGQLRDHYEQLFESKAISLPAVEVLSPRVEDEFTNAELKEALKRLKNGKAPGPNGIRAELLKCGNESFEQSLLKVLNQYWMGELAVPREWRDAEVVSLYKMKGSRMDPNNYRSIFLLDVIGKLFASMVCKRVLPHSEACLSDSQYGFRRRLSTEHAILAVRRVIQNARDNKAPMVLVFVDLMKAFDSVPKMHIWNCIHKAGCSNNAIRSLEGLMDEPTGHLKGSQESFKMYRGVRQGSKEGPLLFNMAFDSIIRETLDESEAGVPMVDAHGMEWKLAHLEYADDLCVFAESVPKAQSALNILERKLAEYGMGISVSKTKWMSIENAGRGETFELNGSTIEKVDSFRYLGSEICADGDQSKSVAANVRSARRCLTRLCPALKNNQISVRAKTKLVEQTIMPTLAYGLTTVVFRASDCDKMEAVFNTARRMMLKVTSRREMTVEELKTCIPMTCIASHLCARRTKFWMNLMDRPENFTHKILTGQLATVNCKRKAYAKCWMRQLKRDVISLGCNTPDEWISRPERLALISTGRPQLTGRREREVQCTHPGCERMFAVAKEMKRHVRQDHERVRTVEIGMLNCPAGNCNKVYKTRGWLSRHIQTCHPQITQVPTPMQPSHSRSTRGQNDNSTRGSHSCPYPGCKKQLPTYKGIVNHCYVKHSFSAIMNRPCHRDKTFMPAPVSVPIDQA